MRLPFAGTYPVTQTFQEHEARRIANGWQFYNGGIDYGLPEGTPIYAVRHGAVSKVETLNTGYGNVVKISHIDGMQTLYAHLSYIVVVLGQIVDPGQMIGRSGNTGNSTGSHLHFEVRQDGVAIDPQPLFDGQIQTASEILIGQTYEINASQTWNLRATPDKGKNVIGQLVGGALVEITEIAGDWVGVTVSGYIHKDAIT
jgi:murein DD-endopeptidase MepM/ murein hydrolase activator NlpD